MKNILILTMLGCCTLLSGCYSTPEVKPRMARFDSSEVNSEAFNFKVTVGTDSSNEIPRSKEIETSESSFYRVSAAMSLGNGWEVKYSTSGEEKLGIKYQFYGAPLEEKVTFHLPQVSVTFAQNLMTTLVQSLMV